MLNFTHLEDINVDNGDDFATLNSQNMLQDTSVNEDFNLDYSYSMARNNSSLDFDRVSFILCWNIFFKFELFQISTRF